MKNERKILIAFILNLSFSVFELVGGLITGSVAIQGDAIHDFGDALSIAVAYIFERKSSRLIEEKGAPENNIYSLAGGIITSSVLLISSVVIIIKAVRRLINPVEINYDAMIILAVVGLVVNSVAAFFTQGKDSFNLKAVNLHMLEDVSGWAAVLLGSVLMRLTGFSAIDSLLSIGLCAFIGINALICLKQAGDILTGKASPDCHRGHHHNHHGHS